MKKIITDTKSLAALLMAGAAFSACSSSDDNIIEQPQNPTEPQVYTMVIKASKGGDTTTRALQPGYDDVLGKNTVDAYWSGDETIEVYQSGVKIGEATAAPSANGNTTVTATLTSAPVPSNDLNFYLGGYNNVYTGQNGLLTGTGSISEKYDYVESLIYSNAYSVEGYNVIPGENTTLNFTDGITKQAIIKFTLKDKGNSDAAISPTALTVTDGTSTVELTNIPEATYTANGGAGVLYVAFPAAGSGRTITLTATVGSDTYTYTTPSAKTFVNGKYYEVTVKMTRKTYPITLSEVTSDYIGSVVTTDGTVYATVANASAANKTAAGMIAYVSGIGQGLAIALADESGTMNWSTAITTAAAHTPAVTGGRWRLPSKEDWENMFIDCGGSQLVSNNMDYSGLAAKLSAAGGTALQTTDLSSVYPYYWSSTEKTAGSSAWILQFQSYMATFIESDNVPENINYVRACLAFGPARGHALASSAVGEIVGSNGLAYYASDKNDLPLGVTAVAMVAYKSATASESLAIQLNASPAFMSWSDACSYSSYPSITGNPGTWRLPSKADWQNMFVGCAKDGDDSDASDNKLDPIAGFKEKIGATGITWQSGVYWSSTDSGSDAWRVDVHFESGNAYASFGLGNTSYLVLGCLAF